jgi:hypothetical protein
MRQQIRRNAESTARTPQEIVSWMGAMQAQDYPMAKWAVGMRLPEATDATVERAITSGEILRTHVLRPTWHFVAAADIRWMLALTAPHIRRAMGSERRLEITDEVVKKTNTLIEKLLRGRQLTREEIMVELANKGIPTDENRSAHLMMHAELAGVVCSGALEGKQQGRQTIYALLDERVPPTPVLKRDEALAELTKRYFLSHGPATVQDYGWWSGLPAADVRAGLEMAKHLLATETIGGQQYWFDASAAIPSNEPPPSQQQSASADFLKNPLEGPETYCLPAFDEFMVSYKDRSASLDATHTSHTITGNGIFKPIIVVNGAVVGIWKRSFKSDRVNIEATLFRPVSQVTTRSIHAALERFGEFLQMKTAIISK